MTPRPFSDYLAAVVFVLIGLSLAAFAVGVYWMDILDFVGSL